MSTTYACEYIVRPPIQTQTPQNAKGLLPYRLPYQYVHHVKPFLQKDLRE